MLKKKKNGKMTKIWIKFNVMYLLVKRNISINLKFFYFLFFQFFFIFLHLLEILFFYIFSKAYFN